MCNVGNVGDVVPLSHREVLVWKKGNISKLRDCRYRHTVSFRIAVRVVGLVGP